MTSPFPFESMLVFGWLASMLLIGVLLRARTPFFQKFLFPSCLIGGLAGLILINVGVIGLATADLETFAYHLFNISFISVGLTRGNDQDNDQDNASPGSKESLKGSVWMALIMGSCFGLQAAAGGLMVVLFGVFGLELFPTFGFLAPLGFEEGPGQALSVGKVWEGFGFARAATLGLTFAAIGYFFAFFVGVPLVNRGIRKGLAAHRTGDLSRDLLTGIISKDKQVESAGKLALHTGNIDSMAFQAALVGFVYLITYAFVKYVGMLLPPDAAKIMWGFCFVFGLVFAILIRMLLQQFGREHMVDPGIQRRVTGWSIDFLMVATIMAIQLPVVWEFLLPLSVISLVNGLLTTGVVVYLGQRLWNYNLERTAAVYGTVTGTVSCGLLLLRIADPDFKTPVAIEIAVMNVLAIVPIGACLLLVNAPVWWNWGVGTTTLVFAGVMGVGLALIRVLKFWDAPG
ncbi:Sodium/glutamate symporter [Olavius algarvensis Delta 1 endosymbiont]|nr:Sodium/glutamate symporter [Olavius algarvensis Delta 1 endosymbiont]